MDLNALVVATATACTALCATLLLLSAVLRRWEKRRPICVLSMDGGGMKGINTAAILEALEARLQMPLGECFDLICGTSAGGIAAMHLALADGSGVGDFRRTLEEVRGLFARASALRQLRDGYQCDLGECCRVARETPPHRRHETVPTPAELTLAGRPATRLFVVSARQSSDGQFHPHLLRNYDSPPGAPVPGSACGWPTDLCMRATSSAPPFFAPVDAPDDGAVHVDGALLANSPAELAVTEARHLWPGRPLLLVSVGSGRPADTDAAVKPSAMNSLFWLKTLVGLQLGWRQTDGAHAAMLETHMPLLAATNPGSRYWRLQPFITSTAIHETDRAVLGRLEKQTETWIQSNAALLDDVAAAVRAAVCARPTGSATRESEIADGAEAAPAAKKSRRLSRGWSRN